MINIFTNLCILFSLKGKFLTGGLRMKCKSLVLVLKKDKKLSIIMSIESAINDLVDKGIILMKPEVLKNVLLKNYGIITGKNDINE